MIDPSSFYDWLEGADKAFEALEDRDRIYRICSKWVFEWFKQGRFDVEEHRGLISKIPEHILVYDKSTEEYLKNGYRVFIKDLGQNDGKLSYAFSLYLMTWNIRRFERYFKKCRYFDLNAYFDRVWNSLRQTSLLTKLEDMKCRNILRDELDEELIKGCFEDMNEILRKCSGVDENEPIGTIKILHITAPSYIPLLDNPIAKALRFSNLCSSFSLFGDQTMDSIMDCTNDCIKQSGLDYETKRNLIAQIEKCLRNVLIDAKSYLQYVKWVKEFLIGYANDIRKLEKETGKSALKLLDEAFYIRYSMDVMSRLK